MNDIIVFVSFQDLQPNEVESLSKCVPTRICCSLKLDAAKRENENNEGNEADG